MRQRIGLASAFILVCTTFAQAMVVDVTTSVDAPIVNGKYEVNVGKTHTLSVFGQLKPADADPSNGIFGWNVDLRVGDPGIIGLLVDTVDRSGWDNEDLTSSSGTPVAWGIDAIYDTSFFDDAKGLSGPVLLFSVDFEALTTGITSLGIEPDYTTGADFLAHLEGGGGDYSAASATINVVPEPVSLSLLAAGTLALLLIWRRRSK